MKALHPSIRISNIATLRKAAIAACMGFTAFTGCTQQIQNSFRYIQQQETFSSQLQINTKIDLLWVVDNSSSMDVSQQKLRDGFLAFASKYMKPTWDIHVAVITTDMYLAHAAFQPYVNSAIPGSIGYKSPYIEGRLATFRNPAYNPTLVNLATGVFDNGLKYHDLNPLWGPNYSRLLPGIHDGPIPALCFEVMPYFLKSVTQCNIRDDQNAFSGPANCLSPAAGQSSLSQCVNTVENDTVRSGRAIISTMPPAGTPADAAWTNQLNQDFMVNLTTGSAGHGSERGIASVLQLLSDNEGTTTSFFRPGSLRGIIFVSDEDDQSVTLPANPPAGYTPWDGYACDQAGLTALNGAAKTSGAGGICCSTPGNNCMFGSAGTSCPSKTVDGFTYTPSICPNAANLMPIASVKTQLDAFFTALDGTGATSPNYFITSIVALSGATIQNLQTARNTMDTQAGQFKSVSIDRADRYIQLGTLVGNGSLALDIGSSDYTGVLDAIGRNIIAKKSTFILTRAPTGVEDMIVTVIHADGSSTVVPTAIYTVSGNVLTITDGNFVLGLAATDQISINYQPKTAAN